MIGLLHVLERPAADARRLHSQLVEFDDPPKRWTAFACRTRGGALPWKTDRLETEPVRAGENTVYFRTRHTAYLLEQEVPLS